MPHLQNVSVSSLDYAAASKMMQYNNDIKASTNVEETNDENAADPRLWDPPNIISPDVKFFVCASLNSHSVTDGEMRPISIRAGCQIGYGVKIEAGTKIQSNVHIAPLAKIGEMVEIGRNSKIGYETNIQNSVHIGARAILEGDCCIHKGVWVGDKVRIRRSHIWPGVHIDDGVLVQSGVHIRDGTKVGKNTSIFHGAKVGKNVTLGSKVTIGWDAEVGDGCKIADHVFVNHQVKIGPSVIITEGKRIEYDIDV